MAVVPEASGSPFSSPVAEAGEVSAPVAQIPTSDVPREAISPLQEAIEEAGAVVVERVDTPDANYLKILTREGFPALVQLNDSQTQLTSKYGVVKLVPATTFPVSLPPVYQQACSECLRVPPPAEPQLDAAANAIGDNTFVSPTGSAVAVPGNVRGLAIESGSAWCRFCVDENVDTLPQITQTNFSRVSIRKEKELSIGMFEGNLLPVPIVDLESLTSEPAKTREMIAMLSKAFRYAVLKAQMAEMEIFTHATCKLKRQIKMFGKDVDMVVGGLAADLNKLSMYDEAYNHFPQTDEVQEIRSKVWQNQTWRNLALGQLTGTLQHALALHPVISQLTERLDYLQQQLGSTAENLGKQASL
jgi:hypothetical protein